MFPLVFAHVANAPLDFSLEKGIYSAAAHITNVAASVEDANSFLGYHIVNLQESTEFTGMWSKACALGCNLVDAASPFLRCQLRASDFTLVGLDVIPDAFGGLWLLEANVPPCMGSQVEKEDAGEVAAASLHEAYLSAAVEQFILPSLMKERGTRRGTSTGEAKASQSKKQQWLNIRETHRDAVFNHDFVDGSDVESGFYSKAMNETAWLSFQICAMNSQSLNQGTSKRKLAADEGECDTKTMFPSQVVNKTSKVHVLDSMGCCDGSADYDI